MGKDSVDALLPERLDESRIVLTKRYLQENVLTLLRNNNLAPLTYDSFPDIERPGKKEIFYHSFDIRDPLDMGTLTFSFHIMQDLKDTALEMLCKAGSNLFYNRILLENVFLLLRHMILFERRLTLWFAPPAGYEPRERCFYYFKRYSPFFLYRDIWAAMLTPYWNAKDRVQADHICQTVAAYFARLLPTHPCQVITCKRVNAAGDKCKDSKACQSCCRNQKGKSHFCGDENFPQKDCIQAGKKLDPALIAAFAECICRNGIDEARSRNGIQYKLTTEADELLKATFAAAKALHPELTGQLWLFLVGYIWYKKGVLTVQPNVIPTIDFGGETILDKQAPADTLSLISYVAACKAAEVDIPYRGDWRNWLGSLPPHPHRAWSGRILTLLPAE